MSDLPAMGLVFNEAPVAPTHIQYLLYGSPGSGKSTAAATAPGPLIWLNIEGPNALAYARKTARERGETIFEITIDPEPGGPNGTGQDVRQVLREVIKHVRTAANPRPQTVVVDTVGKLRAALASQLVQQGSRNTQQQWGDVAKALMGFIRTLRDEEVNLVLLAHESIEDADGERIVRPQIASSGSLPGDILAEMDVVAYCAVLREDDSVRYLGQLVEGRGRRAKDRSGGLGTVRPLDLTDWLEAFRTALGAAESDIPFSEFYKAPTELVGDVK